MKSEPGKRIVLNKSDPLRKEAYILRQTIAAGLMTSRPELIVIAAGELEKNPLLVGEQKELLRLIADLVEDRERMRQEATELRKRLNSSIQNIEGAIAALHRSVDEVDDRGKE